MGVNIIGSGNTNVQQVDPLFSAARVSVRPTDVTSGGWYSQGLTSGALTGAGAAAALFSFRYTGSQVCGVRRVRVASITTTAFSTAQQLDYELFVARSFSASDTGGTAGTLTGNQSKYRTSYSTMGVGDIRIANTGALAAGTRTLDTNPLAYAVGWSGGIGTGILTMTNLLQFDPEDHPLILANNEGFVISGVTAMGSTGVVKLYVDVEWFEATSF